MKEFKVKTIETQPMTYSGMAKNKKDAELNYINWGSQEGEFKSEIVEIECVDSDSDQQCSCNCDNKDQEKSQGANIEIIVTETFIFAYQGKATSWEEAKADYLNWEKTRRQVQEDFHEGTCLDCGADLPSETDCLCNQVCHCTETYVCKSCQAKETQQK